MNLAELFVEVAGDFRPLEQGAQDSGERAGTRAGSAFGDKMKIAVTAAAAATGAALIVGLNGAIQRDASNSKLAAQLGASPALAAKLGDAAGKLYAGNFGENMEEINNALRGVFQNGLAGAETASADIQRVGANVINLGALLEEDADRITSAVSQMLRTGMAKSADEAFDLLAVATQKGVNKSQDLLDTINEYGTQFRILGLDGPHALGLLSQAIQAGARDSDTAADALKEFAIRAVDGSTLSAEGFKTLGLDAKQMGLDVSAGGDRAANALDVTLDRLRDIPDPVLRGQTAVALFGTKAEDLGKALFAMDASKATQALGDVAGAAQRAGDTLGGSASSQLASFKREMEQGLINVAARAIPTIKALFGFIAENKAVIGPVAAVVGTLAVAIWAVNTATAVYTATVAALNAVHLITAARTIATTAATAIHTAVTRGVWLATNLWTAAQWLLNAALAASPVGVIILILVALVAAIVLAYKNSETFRNIVQAAWDGIRIAAQWAWDKALKPIFEAISWYIQNIVVPWVMFLWRNVFEPAWKGISVAIQIAWTLIQVWWGAMKIYVEQVLIPLFLLLWKYVIKPMWENVVLIIQVAWAAIKLVWEALKAYVNTVVIPMWNLLLTVVTKVWNGLRDVITAVWETRIKPLLQAVGGFVENTVVPAFKRGVDAIGKAWDRLQDLAKKPVSFVVNTIVNPLVRGYNAIARKFGGDTVDEIKGFAGGGHNDGYEGQLPGAASDVDNMIAHSPHGPIGLAGGEYIVNARSTRWAKPLLQWINSEKRGFADGGWFDWVTNPLKAATSAFGGPLQKLDQVGSSPFAQVLKAMPRKLWDMLLNAAKSLFTGGGAGGPTGAGPGFPPWPRSPGASRGDSGVWRSIVNLVRQAGIAFSFGNGYRPGDPLWHGSGHAVDFMGFNQDRLAQFFLSMQGRVLELIHRTGSRDYGVSRGRTHAMPTQWPLHRNHLHVAMADGGTIDEAVMGIGHSGRTYSFGEAGPETVTPTATMDAVVKLLMELIDAVRGDGQRLSVALGGLQTRQRQMARAL